MGTILYQLLEALCYFHRNSLIHRDVKASKVLIDSEGAPLPVPTMTARRRRETWGLCAERHRAGGRAAGERRTSMPPVAHGGRSISGRRSSGHPIGARPRCSSRRAATTPRPTCGPLVSLHISWRRKPRRAPSQLIVAGRERTRTPTCSRSRHSR